MTKVAIVPIIFLLLSLFVVPCSADSGAPSRIQAFEAPGNLEVTNDLDCLGTDKVKNTYTPVDLYASAAKCATTGKYAEGAFLFVIAGVYGRYDTMRVADRTAHQAVAVARQTLGLLDEDQQTAFRQVLRTSVGSPEGLAVACREVMRIGPPAYHPRYMIQHGMGAFIGDAGDNGLVKNFDEQAAWKESLTSYLHCQNL